MKEIAIRNLPELDPLAQYLVEDTASHLRYRIPGSVMIAYDLKKLDKFQYNIKLKCHHLNMSILEHIVTIKK